MSKFSNKNRNPDLIPSTEDYGISDEELRLRYYGIDHGGTGEFAPELHTPESEFYEPGSGLGSGLRMGHDRLNDAPDGSYGGGRGRMGETGCSMVDIFAGLASHYTSQGKLPALSDGTVVPVNPNAIMDATRMYLSQKTDVDDQFACPQGTIGNIRGKSGAVMKADQCRMIGREGVKIMTGIDRKNSFGKKVISVPDINLIAGEVPSGWMHPIPKGKNLVDLMRDVFETINFLMGIVDNFLQLQTDYNSVIMGHTHYDPVSIGLSILATGKPFTFFGGQTFQSGQLQYTGAKSGFDSLLCKKDLFLFSMLSTFIQERHLGQFSSNYVNSRHVFTS